MDNYAQLYRWLWHEQPDPIRARTAELLPNYDLEGLFSRLRRESNTLHDTESIRINNVARHMFFEEFLDKSWKKSWPAPLVFKGFDYATNLYSSVSDRSSSDLDLLLPTSHFEDITHQLSQSLSEAPPPKENRFPWEKPSARSFTTGNVSIDIHNSVTMPHQTRLNNEQLFEKAIPSKVRTTKVFFPSAEHRLLIWLQNFSKNAHPLSLKSVLDFTLILKQISKESAASSISLSYVLGRVAPFGLSTAMNIALSYLDTSQLWNHPIPKSMLNDNIYEFDRWVRHGSGHNLMIPKAIHRVFLSPKGQRWRMIPRLLRREIKVLKP